MHQRRPHRFFLALFTFALVAIHLQSRADDSDIPSSMLSPNLSGPQQALVPANAPVPPLAPPPGATAADGSWGIAQPTVDKFRAEQAREAEKYKNIPALCDTAADPNHPNPGIGAPFTSSPDVTWNSKPWKQAVVKFMKEKAQAFDTDSNYHKLDDVNPYTQAAQKARHDYFAEIYGDPNAKDPPHRYGAVITICGMKEDVVANLTQFQKLQAAGTSSDTGDICAKSGKKIYDQLVDAQYGLNRYNAVLKAYLDGGKATSVGTPGHNYEVPSLIVKFADDNKIDHDNINTVSGDRTSKSLAKVPADTQKGLQKEYEDVWGKGTYKDGASERNYKPGLFSDAVVQAKVERARGKALQDSIDQYQGKISDLEARCGFSPVSASTVTGLSVSDTGKEDIDPVTGNPKVKSTVSGSPGDKATKDAVYTGGNQNDNNNDNIDNSGGGKNNHNINNHDGNNNDNNDNNNSVTPPPAASTTGEMGSFLKNNWMYLAGGVLLVGGGVWLYNQYQQQHAYDYVSPLYVPPMTFSNTSVITATASMSSTLTSTGVTITTVTGTNGSVSTAR